MGIGIDLGVRIHRYIQRKFMMPYYTPPHVSPYHQPVAPPDSDSAGCSSLIFIIFLIVTTILIGRELLLDKPIPHREQPIEQRGNLGNTHEYGDGSPNATTNDQQEVPLYALSVGNDTTASKSSVPPQKNSDQVDQVDNDFELYDCFVTADGQYRLQFGAFQNKDNALARQQFIRKKLNTICKVQMSICKKGLYCVYIHGFQTKQDAKDFAMSSPVANENWTVPDIDQ